MIKTTLHTAFKIGICAFALALSFFVPMPALLVNASSCYGSSCTGLYAGSGTGCSAQDGTSFYYNGSAKYEGRISLKKTASSTNRCDTGWTRAYNNSSNSQLYVAASTRYGCANYCYDQSIESGGYPPNSQKIGPGQYIYTPMVGANSIINLIPCGAAGNNIISLPLGNPNPASNGNCGNVF